MIVSQLYGSTTVVMATHGFTLKMAKFDPLPKTSEWTDWKNIWHDWLRHRPKQSSKIWFRKNFPGRRYTYPTYKGSSFFFFFFFLFKNFYALWWGCSQNGWTDFDAQYVIRRRLVRVRPFSRNEKYRSMTLTLKRSKSAILFDPKNIDPNFLENGTR